MFGVFLCRIIFLREQVLVLFRKWLSARSCRHFSSDLIEMIIFSLFSFSFGPWIRETVGYKQCHKGRCFKQSLYCPKQKVSSATDWAQHSGWCCGPEVLKRRCPAWSVWCHMGPECWPYFFFFEKKNWDITHIPQIYFSKIFECCLVYSQICATVIMIEF